jgi:hypothetical protein
MEGTSVEAFAVRLNNRYVNTGFVLTFALDCYKSEFIMVKIAFEETKSSE